MIETNAETRVSQYLIKGYSNQEIADELGLNVKTVKFHLTNIYKKHGVKSRSEYMAIQTGFKKSEREIVMNGMKENKSIAPEIIDRKSLTQQEKVKFIDDQFKVGEAITHLHSMMKTVTSNEINPATVNAACNCVARLNETINTAIQAARFLNER